MCVFVIIIRYHLLHFTLKKTFKLIRCNFVSIRYGGLMLSFTDVFGNDLW